MVDYIWALSQTGDVKYSVPWENIGENFQVEKFEVGELYIQLKVIVVRVYCVVHGQQYNPSISFKTTLRHCISDIDDLRARINSYSYK